MTDTIPTYSAERSLTADVEFNDDWEVDPEADYAAAFHDAVETVRDDHDAEVLIEADELYVLKVYWNTKTSEVRFAVFGHHGTWKVTDTAATLGEFE
jgi:hypothetical protein